MAQGIKIIAVVLTGTGGIVRFYLLDRTLPTATRISHLLSVIDCYTRLAAWRIFEIAFRLYSFPVYADKWQRSIGHDGS